MTWAIIQTTPQGQHIARLRLRQAGFVVYCPEETIWKNHKRKARTREERPLFVGYLFASSRKSVWRAGHLEGVRGIIVPNMDQARVRQHIHSIWRAQRAGAFDHTEKKREAFAPGAKARIGLKGPLHNQIGVIVSAAKDGMVKLLLNEALRWETTQHIDDLELAA